MKALAKLRLVQSGTRLFVVGGSDKKGDIRGNCYEINVETGKVEPRAELPHPRLGYGCCSTPKFIYTAGGLTTGQKPTDWVDWYHVEENRWAALPNLPVKCHGLSLSVFNSNQLIAVGGSDSSHKQMTSIWRLTLEPLSR